MNGKRYYITTLESWQRRAGKFTNSHWLALSAAEAGMGQGISASSSVSCEERLSAGTNGAIVVLVEGDEGVHLDLEDDPAFEPLPHPLSQKEISESAHVAFAPMGVRSGSTAFEATEILGKFHPLLRHRVF